MASADVAPASDVTPGFDIPRISSFLQLPQKIVEDISAIDQAFVSQFLTALTTKARQYDELKAEKLRVDVEMEQNARTAIVRSTGMKTRLDAALAEAQQLRVKVTEAGESHIVFFFQYFTKQKYGVVRELMINLEILRTKNRNESSYYRSRHVQHEEHKHLKRRRI